MSEDWLPFNEFIDLYSVVKVVIFIFICQIITLYELIYDTIICYSPLMRADVFQFRFLGSLLQNKSVFWSTLCTIMLSMEIMSDLWIEWPAMTALFHCVSCHHLEDFWQLKDLEFWWCACVLVVEIGCLVLWYRDWCWCCGITAQRLLISNLLSGCFIILHRLLYFVQINILRWGKLSYTSHRVLT